MSLPGWHHVACRAPVSLIPLRMTHCTIIRSPGEIKMTTKSVIAPSPEDTLSRRGFFMKLGILFNGFAAMVLAVPVVGFLLSSVTRGSANGYLSWVPLGRIDEFPEGETRLATFRHPNVIPT